MITTLQTEGDAQLRTKGPEDLGGELEAVIGDHVIGDSVIPKHPSDQDRSLMEGWGEG